MKPKPSRTLATIIANGAERSDRNPHLSLLNAVALEMVTQSDCHARHIMDMLLDPYEASHIALRVAQLAECVEHIDHTFLDKSDQLSRMWSRLQEHYTCSLSHNAEATIHSGHLLHYLLTDKQNHFGVVASLYDGLNPLTVSVFNEDLPAQEDYYSDLRVVNMFWPIS